MFRQLVRPKRISFKMKMSVRIDGIVVATESGRTRTEIRSPSITVSNTYLTWVGTGPKPGLHDEKPACRMTSPILKTKISVRYVKYSFTASQRKLSLNSVWTQSMFIARIITNT